ncbi:MAG: hypothetical protein COA43_14730 [Robiginitomaculum sp.]|nr:MAG: hypothetical protein COA43_14730 [Robiginitomaculum sp.]
MIRVSFGDVNVSAMGEDFIFRPTFINALKLGSPKEIVKTFSDIHMLDAKQEILSSEYASEYLKSFVKRILPTACYVLANCCDDDCSDLVGTFNGTKYRAGLLPIDDIVVISKHLLKHMIIGKPDNKKQSKNNEYSDEFDVAELVDIAMLNLGLSEQEALSLSMTRFQSMVKIKYPEPHSDIPSDQEYDDCMAWSEKVSKAREAMH